MVASLIHLGSVFSLLLHAAVAQCTCSNATTPAPSVATNTPAPVQTLTAPISVDFVVLTVGIALLLILFVFSFYFTVIWPKRAFLEYRRQFESLVRDELVHQDMKNLRIGDKKRQMVYSGAASAATGRAARRIPTMQEVEMAMQKEEPQDQNGILA